MVLGSGKVVIGKTLFQKMDKKVMEHLLILNHEISSYEEITLQLPKAMI